MTGSGPMIVVTYWAPKASSEKVFLDEIHRKNTEL